MTAVPPAGGLRVRWRAAHQRWHATRLRWRHSLKWRLVTMFLLLALATTGVFLFGMQRVLQGGWQGYAKPMVADYVDRLAAEIGSPPAGVKLNSARRTWLLSNDATAIALSELAGEPSDCV